MVKVHKPVGSVFNSEMLMKRKSMVFKDCTVYKFLVCALIKTMIMSYLCYNMVQFCLCTG